MERTEILKLKRNWKNLLRGAERLYLMIYPKEKKNAIVGSSQTVNGKIGRRKAVFSGGMDATGVEKERLADMCTQTELTSVRTVEISSKNFTGSYIIDLIYLSILHSLADTLSAHSQNATCN
jgi:hypothetical protein